MKKNDKVMAIRTEKPFITYGKQYTVLGVKKLKSGEVLIKISTDEHKRRYLDASMFDRVEDLIKERLINEDL